MAETKTKGKRTSKRSTSKASTGKSSTSKASSGSSSSQPKRRSTGSASQGRSSSRARGSAPANSNHQHSAREIVIEAMRQLQDLVGRPIEGVTGIEKNGKEWSVTVDVLELERIPNTTDVLGNYEVTVDE